MVCLGVVWCGAAAAPALLGHVALLSRDHVCERLYLRSSICLNSVSPPQTQNARSGTGNGQPSLVPLPLNKLVTGKAFPAAW